MGHWPYRPIWGPDFGKLLFFGDRANRNCVGATNVAGVSVED